MTKPFLQHVAEEIAEHFSDKDFSSKDLHASAEMYGRTKSNLAQNLKILVKRGSLKIVRERCVNADGTTSFPVYHFVKIVPIIEKQTDWKALREASIKHVNSAQLALQNILDGMTRNRGVTQ